MILLTSISPAHANEHAQAIAVASWIRHGLLPVSFNSPDDVAILSERYPLVSFIPSSRNGTGLFKAPYALINAFIDYAREMGIDHAFIINSDIAIADPDGLLPGYIARSERGLIFANRFDHNGDDQNPTRYDHGFDAFIIHRNYFSLLPQSVFAMGQTWWDYWIPYRFIRSQVPIDLVKEPIFLHHRHAIQYDQREWERMTEHFVWVERYGKLPYISNGRNAQNITNEVYRLIMRHAR